MITCEAYREEYWVYADRNLGLALRLYVHRSFLLN